MIRFKTSITMPSRTSQPCHLRKNFRRTLTLWTRRRHMSKSLRRAARKSRPSKTSSETASAACARLVAALLCTRNSSICNVHVKLDTPLSKPDSFETKSGIFKSKWVCSESEKVRIILCREHLPRLPSRFFFNSSVPAGEFAVWNSIKFLCIFRRKQCF